MENEFYIGVRYSQNIFLIMLTLPHILESFCFESYLPQKRLIYLSLLTGDISYSKYRIIVKTSDFPLPKTRSEIVMKYFKIFITLISITFEWRYMNKTKIYT